MVLFGLTPVQGDDVCLLTGILDHLDNVLSPYLKHAPQLCVHIPQWRKHSSQWDPRIKAPRGPVKTLACVKSLALLGLVMGDRGFPG